MHSQTSAAWPKTPAQLKEQGYRAQGRKPCKGCKAEISWTITPNEKWMPLTPLPDGKFQPHWTDCPARDQFAYNKKKKAEA